MWQGDVAGPVITENLVTMGPLLRGDDSNKLNDNSEPVIDPDPEQARLEAMICAGEPIGPVGEVDKEIFDPRRPGARQRNFHAGACRPAGVEPRLAQAPELDFAL